MIKENMEQYLIEARYQCNSWPIATSSYQTFYCQIGIRRSVLLKIIACLFHSLNCLHHTSLQSYCHPGWLYKGGGVKQICNIHEKSDPYISTQKATTLNFFENGLE